MFNQVAKYQMAISVYVFKLQPSISFDLNGLKNSSTKHFENNLKSMHFLQKLMEVPKDSRVSEWAKTASVKSKAAHIRCLKIHAKELYG